MENLFIALHNVGFIMNQYNRSCKSELSESFLWKTSRSRFSHFCKRFTGYVENAFYDHMRTGFYYALIRLKFRTAQQYLVDVIHIKFQQYLQRCLQDTWSSLLTALCKNVPLSFGIYNKKLKKQMSGQCITIRRVSDK